MSDLAVISKPAGPRLPALVAGAGDRAVLRFLEYLRRNGAGCASEGHSNITSVAVFDFTDFARKIYSEKPEIYIVPLPIDEEEFLLPALYGGDGGHGETSSTFEALVVLEGPSKPFTKKLWKTQCVSPEEAITRHREIFYRWAFIGPQAELFRGLVGEPSKGDFFRRLYITDVWKDAAFRENRRASNPGYERYWRSKLQIEISGVATGRVIFVGGEARDAGLEYVPPDTPRDHIPFPKWTKTFRAELHTLLAKVRGERISDVEPLYELDHTVPPPRVGSVNSAVLTLLEQLPLSFTRDQFEAVIPHAMRFNTATGHFGVRTTFPNIQRAKQAYFSEFKKRRWVVPHKPVPIP